MYPVLLLRVALVFRAAAAPGLPLAALRVLVVLVRGTVVVGGGGGAVPLLGPRRHAEPVIGSR